MQRKMADQLALRTLPARVTPRNHHQIAGAPDPKRRNLPPLPVQPPEKLRAGCHLPHSGPVYKRRNPSGHSGTRVRHTQQRRPINPQLRMPRHRGPGDQSPHAMRHHHIPHAFRVVQECGELVRKCFDWHRPIRAIRKNLDPPEPHPQQTTAQSTKPPGRSGQSVQQDNAACFRRLHSRISRDSPTARNPAGSAQRRSAGDDKSDSPSSP